MTDINGNEIKVGQIVAFSAMRYGGTTHFINYGEVFKVNNTPKRQYCKVKLIKSGQPFSYKNVYEFRDDGHIIKKLLIIK